MNRKLTNIAVTGGAGFIGSNFIQYMFSEAGFSGNIINIDRLTYAGNPENLADIEKKFGGARYFFEKADICDPQRMSDIIKLYDIDAIAHFAAESHVDRSILGPGEFIKTNITGTFNLIEAARSAWGDRRDVLFHHVSTDEVFGSLGESGYFREQMPYDPRNPYSASKASSDLIVKSYYHTYKMPVTISHCSNNYGPYQFPEKLIPLMILNIREEKDLPVYGDGKNIRDWIYAGDHASAIWMIMNKGKDGESYNIGGENEWENIKLVNVLCEKMALFLKKDIDYFKKLIRYVKDRPGHDRRYAIDCSKIKNGLNWRQSVDFDRGLDITIRWYMENDAWIKNVKTGGYRNWIEKNYAKR